MMKTVLRHFLFFALFSPKLLSAQCSGGTLAGTISPLTIWQNAGTSNVAGGTYYNFNTIAGRIYYFSFCSADFGSSMYNTQISINTSAGVLVPGAFNDDYCGNQSYLAWTAPASGTYRVLVNLYNCASQTNMGSMVYKYSSALTCPGNLGLGVTNVSALPYSSGPGTTCGFGNELSSNNMTSCGNSSFFGGEDKIWIFTPAVTGTVSIDLTSAGAWNGLMLYQGCPLIGQSGTCLSVSQSSSGNQSIVACVNAGVAYYLVVDASPNPATCNAYTNLTISAPTASGGCPLGTGSLAITLPYSSTGRTTCGKFDDQAFGNTINCGSSNYLTGEDEVFVFTPTTSGNISINLTSLGTYTGLMLYQGCPLSTTCSGVGGTCVANAQSSSGNKTLCTNVIAGQTYYLIVDSWGTGSCNAYNISITAPSAVLAGSLCSNAVPISTLPFYALNESTSCNGNDYTNTSLGSCASLFESGEDRVYVYTATQSECIEITITGASSNSIGFQVYKGCPGVAGTTCIIGRGGANSGLLSSSVVLPSAGTYYFIIDSWAPPTTVTYNLEIKTFGNGVQNDLPCNAIPLTIGIPLASSNTCSGGSLEPSAPACWISPNIVNSVWYSVQAPATGQIRVRVVPGSIINPQMAFYSGTCGTTMTLVTCNDNAAPCGQSINYSSEVLVTGCTPGATYYVVVDGNSDLTGTFTILAIDGTTTLPPLTNGQDCGIYLPVCDSSMSFGNPGFQASGNICDFTGGILNCLLTGERGSAWFEIPISANGNLEFTIIPKDWPGAPSTSGTDYDFAIWKIQGSGAVTCAQIATNIAPLRCNYQIFGVTGLYSAINNTSPPQYPGFASAFNNQLPVLNGEKYALVVSNFSNSSYGFDLVFGKTSPINYTPSSTAAIWSGGVDTDWYKKDNWGGCALPSCTRDAIINGGIFLQPTVSGLAASKSLLINPGARLTIPSGQTLSVCENFTNFGTLNADINSTVLFSSASAIQNISGNLTGSNAFGALTITKTGGSVNTLQNTDVKGVFTISSPTSLFNVSGRIHRVAGNFLNFGIYTPGAGTLEFNGTMAQSYRNYDVVNNVVVNHSGPGVTLTTNLLMASSGTLNLVNGKIITTPSYEVSVSNRNPAAVSTGSVSSFIQGFLRRYINGTGSYDYPVGESTKGFQRVNVNFAYAASPTIIDNIKVNFAPHVTLPSPLGVSECSLTYSSTPLNNGKWIIAPSNNSTSGLFDLTLYNLNFSNAANSWTIMSNNGFSWGIANGTCVFSPVNTVRRNAMSGFYEFGTAQGPSTLPVNWLNVNAIPKDDRIQIKWSTASETNNSGFEVQKLQAASNLFESMGWQNGSGNSNQVNHYSFDDLDVSQNEDYFYQIKQVDFNGTTSYSDIVHARLNEMDFKGMYLFPNPITSDSRLNFYLDESIEVKISLVNAMGEVMKQENLGRMTTGKISVNITSFFTSIPAGIYSFRWEAGERIEHCKALYINTK